MVSGLHGSTKFSSDSTSQAGKIFSQPDMVLLRDICALVIPKTSTAGAAEVDAAVASAQAGFAVWSATSAVTAGSEARFVVVAADAFGNRGSAGLAVAATAGGLLGARWGSRVARPAQLRPALALVLLVAALKLVIALAGGAVEG